VVIAGYGPAGASAAIAAHDAGARVIIVESGRRGGGNARYSGGFLCDLPADRAVDHLDALCFGRTGRGVLGAYAAGLHDLDGWLRSLGGTTVPFQPPPVRLPAPFPSWAFFPAGRDIRYSLVKGAGRPGEALWDVLDAAIQTRGIEVRYETSAERLEIDPEGAVTGLRISGAPGEYTLTARGGVVLACGGFEADPALADAYLPLGPSWPVGHPGNTGAGLRMAQQAGAALWHMYGCFGWFAFRCAEYSSPFAIDFFGASHLFTDADGRRFADETGYEVHDRLRALLSYLPRNPNRPRLPSWAVFDEATRLAGPLNGLLGTPNDYTWSADNAVEIDRGWILGADSAAELAAKMGAEPAILEDTLAEYNASAQAGRDERFGRSPDTLVPLDTRRLYAIETWPGIAGTTGGPRHDGRARVLRPDGQPIPGLYAAGAVSLVWGHLIEHGGGLTDAMVFGRYAGAEAAARTYGAGAEAAARGHSAGSEAAARGHSAGSQAAAQAGQSP
jgi:succinate dehydrogenase/fumarate reductase flavoprotein subunit